MKRQEKVLGIFENVTCYIWELTLEKPFSVLLVSVNIFKKKKLIPPTNMKLICCHPAGHHKWKHFHNEKTDQNMLHIWWLQIQRKQSLQLTVFWVNFLMRVSKLESSLAEVGKITEKRVESCNMFFLWVCRDVRSWLLTGADLVAGTAQRTTSFLLPTFIVAKPTYSQGRGSLGNVFWLGSKKTHPTHPVPILLSSIPHAPLSASTYSPWKKEGKDSSAIWAPPPFEELSVSTQSYRHASFQCHCNMHRSLVNFEEATFINNLVFPWQSWLNCRISWFLTQDTQTECYVSFFTFISISTCTNLHLPVSWA